MQNSGKKIHFILTGGTIDSKTTGQERDILNEHSVIPKHLTDSNPHQSFIFSEIVWKDSRDLTQEDRANILKVVETSPSTLLIITHGTFTMPETARFLKDHLARKDQTIILTGSLIPWEGFENSDAPSNLKYALNQALALPPAVYVCMNGQTFSPEEAVKDETTGKFYSAFVNKQ